MAEGLLMMSVQERERSHVVRQAVEQRLSQQEGAERLGIGVRQFKRLVRPWQRDGAAGLVSRQRGRPSHNRLGEEGQAGILRLLREKYEDFGPTLAAEKLLELEGIAVSRETVRQLQIGAKLWNPACTGGSTGTPRAPLRLPLYWHSASRGSPPMDYRHKPRPRWRGFARHPIGQWHPKGDIPTWTNQGTF
jgi:transposase